MAQWFVFLKSQTWISKNGQEAVKGEYNHATVIAIWKELVLLTIEQSGERWIPGEKITPGETPDLCALNELKKKAGVIIKADQLKSLSDFITGNCRCTMFELKLRGNTRP